MAGSPVATIVWSTELMNSAMTPTAKISLRRRQRLRERRTRRGPGGPRTGGEPGGLPGGADRSAPRWGVVGQSVGSAVRLVACVHRSDLTCGSVRLCTAYRLIPAGKHSSSRCHERRTGRRLRGHQQGSPRQLNATSTDEGLDPDAVLGTRAGRQRGALALAELTELEA